MIVYPGSTVTVKTGPSESKTIVIVSGLASAMVAPEPPTLLKVGQSLHLAPSDQVLIENNNNAQLILIQIMMKDERKANTDG
jgi:quercetin dioxygenase-like cupin family protein